MTKTSKPVIDLQAFLKGPAQGDVNSSVTSSATATLLFDLRSELGEGIVYDDITDQIVWTDILGRRFHRLTLHTAELETMELPKMLGSFALLSSGKSSYEGGYLFAWEDGFQLYNPSLQKALSPMSHGEPVNPDKLPTRLNDGRCDPLGRRYICGGFYGGKDEFRMKVFSCHWNTRKDPTEGEPTTLVHEPLLLDPVRVTNSLQFSPDGKTMYFADSPTQQIFKYDYHAEAATTAELLSNKQLVYQVEMEHAVPDGSCVDAEGFLWNATWWNGVQGSRVRRIDPSTGKVVFEVHMPDETSQVSCCCFGGEQKDILFITTAGEKRDRNKEPHAGGLYAIKLTGVKGRLEARFQC